LHLACKLTQQRKQVPHASPESSVGICAGIFIEPMQWMMTHDASFARSNDGKLLCPSCTAKLGSWNWIGVKYAPRQPYPLRP
jgi:dual specificity phosphatase 12